jgi:aspartate/methionine/tyrosine aminotransferase
MCVYRAFYFLVPVPSEVSEEEAVDILAREYGVLLMPGGAFGAPGHL